MWLAWGHTTKAGIQLWLYCLKHDSRLPWIWWQRGLSSWVIRHRARRCNGAFRYWGKGGVLSVLRGTLEGESFFWGARKETPSGIQHRRGRGVQRSLASVFPDSWLTESENLYFPTRQMEPIFLPASQGGFEVSLDWFLTNGCVLNGG